MKRSIALVAALTLVVAACSATLESGTSESLPGEPVDSAIMVSTTASSVSTTSIPVAADSGGSDAHQSALAGTTTSNVGATSTTESGPPPEGDSAPDFTLALGEDGDETFTLSEEAKPVFMIFWAEW